MNTDEEFLSFWLNKCEKSVAIVTRNNIVRKLARDYCLCYCKTFSIVPDSTECKFFLPKSTVYYLYHLKSSNTIAQRKTTNTGKHFYL